jgi:hypothetical protein
MKPTFFRFWMLVFLMALTACSTPSYREKSISISGAIEVPLIGDGDKYWIDNGPFFVSNRDPLITYRVISKQELEFAGSDKPVYEFLKSSFSEPDGIVEESFRGSHEGYEFSKLHRSGLDIYAFSSADESKAYISSSSIDFAVEVYSEGPRSIETIKTITNSAKLTKGD